MYPVENFTLDSKLLQKQRLWWLWQIWGVNNDCRVWAGRSTWETMVKARPLQKTFPPLLSSCSFPFCSWFSIRRKEGHLLLLHCIGTQEQTSRFSSCVIIMRHRVSMKFEVNRKKPGKWKCYKGTFQTMNFDLDKKKPLMEFVKHVMNNEEERVKGIALLVLNIRKRPGSYEKKLSHWTTSVLGKNIKYFKEVKREEGVFV